MRNRAAVLVFDSTNWDQAKTVYVAAANDEEEEGTRNVAVSHTVQAVITDPTADTDDDGDRDADDAAAQAATVAAYDGIKVRNVMVTVIDNDTAGILLTEVRRDAYDDGTLVLEGADHGITDQYTVELTKAPTAPVTVHLDYDHAQLLPDKSEITFTAANWNQPVTVTVSAVNELRCARIRSSPSSPTRPAARMPSTTRASPRPWAWRWRTTTCRACWCSRATAAPSSVTGSPIPTPCG